MFLGTSSGGGPSESRNCSSLICDFMDDYSLWMVDCAEGTIRQFQFQPQGGFQYRANKVDKIFITHMHADHIMGIVPFLRNVLLPPVPGTSVSHPAVRKPPKLEIYGPAGLRTFVRQIMKMTLTHTAETYVVHELLTDNDPTTPCEYPNNGCGFNHETPNQSVMHVSEVAGSDIRQSPDGFWRSFTSGKGRVSDIIVDAGSIHHRDPCLGYVFTESDPPRRKIVSLGDTHDPSEIVPLCVHPSPSLLIHEATDAHIPAHADVTGKLSKRAPEEVLQKSILRGHSVPAMAGEFAKAIGAARLVLNHIGGRFPAPRHSEESRATVIREIERQATEAWCSGQAAIAAWDFLRIDVPMSNLVRRSFHPQISGQVTISQNFCASNTADVSLNYANEESSNPASGTSNSHHQNEPPYAKQSHIHFDSCDDKAHSNKNSNNNSRTRKRRR